MDDPITFESIDISMSANLKDPVSVKSSDDYPFKILIMGDFSGRANRGLETDGADVENRRLYAVDRDCDDAVMEKIGVSVRIPSAGPSSPLVELGFNELEDFHPEQIYYRSPLFKILKETRRKLLNPDTFAETAARFSEKPLAAPHEEPVASTGKARKPQAVPGVTSSSDLLDQILEAGSGTPGDSGTAHPATDWDRFLDDLVGPYLVPDIEKEQDALVGSVDRSIAGIMNSILHHHDFQAIEANWRALRFVIRRIDTGENLQVYLLDLTRAELSASLTACEDLADCAIAKKLAAAGQESSGQVPWSLIAGLYTFEKTKSDAVVLARAGAMGELLNAPFVAAADGSVIGCSNIAESPDPNGWTTRPPSEDENAWQVVRSLPEAAWVGLAMPRFLVRLPYGEKTDPVDVFDFEEMPGDPPHDHYLWANPAFAVVLVLGRAFGRSGWALMQQLETLVDGLPLHLFQRGDERLTKPCCEVLLTDRALSKMVTAGVMPLVSFKDQDRAALARMQSIERSGKALSGRWS
ncbi:hypothetical protein DSCO28_20710 [Desulfosarcina ovata subsp. sediminis]|uniref:TssC1 N-terminal domain-containing protein n=1 Tax=Desulfosarcina ovata subsp. sediminis TaxID=885957 RepID=A0A5K7ZMA9_9BACT|nr:type VI secretion system contractile sheath large subunit [Desulfosarcina ovata]BBO81505.1 hypothetical protein DSCO28_20710 [Desulfosarcina ovata subsp. sediminis]